VLDYAAFGTMQLGFTIFTKLFHSVQFSLLWSFLRKLLRRPLTAQTNPKLSRFGFVLRTDATPFLPPGASALILFGSLSYGGH
ncbi:MAG: hypothetical protein MRZ90_05280, partial [Candidatus Gastranaerophilales bacterium]|nr:hypothetical protein [Candidatus Gastranaerophilales bacterium]